MSTAEMSAACSGALIGPFDQAQRASNRVHFRRSLTLAVLTLVVPGSAQLIQGNRRLGLIALRTWLALWALVGVAALTAATSRTLFLHLATNGPLLWLVRWGLVALAVGWVYLVFDSWKLGRPARLPRGQLAFSATTHTVIAVGAAAALLFAAHTVAVMNGFAGTVFAATATTKPHDGRYNILLLGADSGSSRVGMRPDSINVASVDAKTGRAVLIGLPRNLQKVPFRKGSVMAEQFPKGFDCPDAACMLNAVSTWADDHRKLFGGDDHPGITATMDAVEGVTGLKLNYYALVNMRGLVSLVNAVGGVKLTVTAPIARFGHTELARYGNDRSMYIKPGTRTLKGKDVLWYARSRVQSDDWTRMARQKCVLNAMVHQLSPTTVLTKSESIATSSAAMLETDIPRSDLATFAEMALKTRAQPIASVSLVPPKVNTVHPDFTAIRSMVHHAVATSEGSAEVSALATSQLPHLTAPVAQVSAPQSSLSQVAAAQSAQAARKANRTNNLDATC